MKKILKRNSRVIFLFILALIVTSLFIDQIAYRLGQVGNSIYEKVESITAGITLFLIALCYYYFPKFKTNFIFNKKASFLVFYLFVVYFYLRVLDDSLLFAPYEFLIKFSDSLFILLLFHIYVLLRTLRKETILDNNRLNSENSSFFLQDTLFTDEEIDNEKILNKLIESLNNFKPDHSFSVGLNAVWGYGKSSFLKKFEKKFKFHNPDSIIFWNHIWKNKGSQAIIENFFEELKENLKPYSSSISNDIDKYVEAVLSLGTTDITRYFKSGIKLLEENETLERYYNEINRNIKVIDRQIIILLDDLDRLEKEEILNTLKLIRTISDFENVIFIAGYDRKYIVNTIDKEQENFLDKIFNVEINLIPFDDQLIVDELLRRVDKAYSFDEISLDKKNFKNAFKVLFENNDQNIDFIFEVDKTQICSSKELSYQDFLNTYRDVKRFINEFRFNASFLESEENVIAEEYILLKLCSYRFREVQNLILNRIPSIMSSGIIDEVNGEIRQFGGTSTDNVYLYDQSAKSKVYELLRNYSYVEREIINSVMCRLFGNKTVEFYLENPNSISKIYYTDIYVRNNIVAGQLSVSQLQKAFELNQLYQIAEEISSSTKQSKFQITNELRQFIYNNRNLSSRNQFLDFLKTLNFIILHSTIKDDENIFEIFHYSRSKFYQDQKEFLDDIGKGVKMIPVGYLDRLFSELFLDILRATGRKNYKSHLIRLNRGLFSLEEVKHLLIEKLRDLIKDKESPNLVFKRYSMIAGEIFSENFILRAEEASVLMKKDIENRFHEYLKSDLFNFYSGKLSERKPSSFTQYGPNPLLSQIFSNPATLKSLTEDPNNEDNFFNYTIEGWNNLNRFIQSAGSLGKGIEDPEEIRLAKALSETFVKKGCVNLTENEYEQAKDLLLF